MQYYFLNVVTVSIHQVGVFALAKWCGSFFVFFYLNQAMCLVIITAVWKLSGTPNTSKECWNTYFKFCCFLVSCLLLLALACCTLILSYLPGPPPQGWAGLGQESASPPTKGDGTLQPTLPPSQPETLPAEWSVPAKKYIIFNTSNDFNIDGK